MRPQGLSLAGPALVVFLLASCSGEAGSNPGLADQSLESLRTLCLDFVNARRAELALPVLTQWEDAQACSDRQAAADLASGEAHGSFGTCGERAQNTCPGWSADTTLSAQEDALQGCLWRMWDEGPGVPYSEHGHYLNMASESFSGLACGFALDAGRLWVNMNFR